MLFAAAVVLTAASWIPMRWASADPESLTLLRETPVNCLLVEQPQWSDKLAAAAKAQKLALLGVVHPSETASSAARRAGQLGFAGVVLEGDFDEKMSASVRDGLSGSSLIIVELQPRRKLRLDAPGTVLGTSQGVWPGVQASTGGEVKAAPSGAPWIDTNTGFLRFVKASTAVPVWIANAPPEKTVINTERYLQAIGDAAMVGAHWVIALDDDLQKRLLQHEPKAMATWKKMSDLLRFYQGQNSFGDLQPYGKLAIIQDTDSGALLSGGILDMIAVKHTPVRPVASRRLSTDSLQGTKMTVDVDPSSLKPEQRELLKSFTRGGGTLLNGPPSWKFPTPSDNRITLSNEDTQKLDQIWKDVNNMTNRQNMGARLFNVSSMLSSLLASPDGKKWVLQLVNYSDYPVEEIAVHLLGKHAKVRMMTPDGKQQDLTPYETEEGVGVDISRIETAATLVIDN